MARPRKTAEEIQEKVQNLDEAAFRAAVTLFTVETRDRLDEIEKVLLRLQEKPRSIHKVEEFNGEEILDVKDESRMKMAYEDKLLSMKNAIKILPPNMIENGRHAKANVEAICGFKIDEAMMDAAYENYTHE